MASDALAEVRREDWRESLDRILPVVYDELRVIAHRHLSARERGGTLTTTGVVHEAYLKLADQAHPGWRDRAHFMALASVAMRQILIDSARARAALKRGGLRRPVTLDDDAIPCGEQPEALLELDAALQRLSEIAPRLARVIELRFFGGMSEDEVAVTLDVTTRTVQRDWMKARVLLQRVMED